MMTVRDLRKAIEGVDDTLPVTVRATDGDDFVCAPLVGIGVEIAHDENETVFLALDAGSS